MLVDDTLPRSSFGYALAVAKSIGAAMTRTNEDTSGESVVRVAEGEAPG